MSGKGATGPSPRRGGGGVLRGLLLIGRGRAEGLDYFNATRDGFLAGLSPPIAFLLVFGALVLSQRPRADTLGFVLVLLCGILMPPVLSHLMARLWKRGDHWLRYATASLWSNWLVFLVYPPAILLASILVAGGVSKQAAGTVMTVTTSAYMLWLAWFLAWKGLAIGWFKALLTMAVMMAAYVAMALLADPILRAFAAGLQGS